MSKIDLFADYVDLEAFSKEVSRTSRAVRDWLNQPDGLPYTRIGNRILIHIPTAREWLFSRMRRPNPPRAVRRRRSASEEATC